MKYKAALEKILTNKLFRENPGPFANVLISDKGEFALLYSGGAPTKRMLSQKAKEYLRTGGVLLVGGESWYEPEEGK